jgi:hypothetical protein
MGLSQHVPDRQKWRRISTGQAPLFGKTGQPSACIPIKHPMTNSDMEREKEGRMTRKFLMTVAIVAIALAPSIGIGPAQAHGVGGGFGGGGFHGGGFGGRGFYGGYGRGFYGGYGRCFYGGYGGYLSGLLWVWLFPVLLLLLLIGCSWRRERRSSATKPKVRQLGELWIFNALHFHPPAGGEYLSVAMPA